MNEQPQCKTVLIPFICLRCGSFDGEHQLNGSQDWWWRLFYQNQLVMGRIGPFCSEECVHLFSLDDNPYNPPPVQYMLPPPEGPIVFSTIEKDRMGFHRWRTQEDVRAQIEAT